MRDSFPAVSQLDYVEMKPERVMYMVKNDWLSVCHCLQYYHESIFYEIKNENVYLSFFSLGSIVLKTHCSSVVFYFFSLDI